jgi:UDP-N-acetylmuramoyl-tripeptide--D-alanyl-D-alanine ligase
MHFAPIYRLYQGDYDVAVFECAENLSPEAYVGFEPDLLILTNVLEVHVDSKRNSRESMLQGMESSLVELLRPTGQLYIWNEDEFLSKLSIKLPRTIKRLSSNANTENYIDNLQPKAYDGVDCDLVVGNRRISDVHIPIPGKIYAQTALIAASIGVDFGLNSDEIREGIKTYKPEGKRTQIVKKNGVSILSDTYNSAYHAFVAMLESFVEFQGRKLVFFNGFGPSMGNKSVHEDFCQKIGSFMSGKQIDVLVCVDEAEYVCCDAVKRGWGDKLGLYLIKNRDEIPALLPDIIRNGDNVFVKGAAYTKFDEITDMCVKYLEETGG